MKQFICLLFLFLCLGLKTFAIELKGEASFNVASARSYIQEEQVDNVEITGPYKLEMNNTERVVYSYNTLGEVIGITVQYKGEPAKTYIYNKNKILMYVENYDRPITEYPHRGYRYNLAGELVLTSLTVSKDEMFRFDTDGHLLAHSLNGIIYDENARIIGRGK